MSPLEYALALPAGLLLLAGAVIFCVHEMEKERALMWRLFWLLLAGGLPGAGLALAWQAATGGAVVPAVAVRGAGLGALVALLPAIPPVVREWRRQRKEERVEWETWTFEQQERRR